MVALRPLRARVKVVCRRQRKNFSRPRGLSFPPLSSLFHCRESHPAGHTSDFPRGDALERNPPGTCCPFSFLIILTIFPPIARRATCFRGTEPTLSSVPFPSEVKANDFSPETFQPLPSSSPRTAVLFVHNRQPQESSTARPENRRVGRSRVGARTRKCLQRRTFSPPFFSPLGWAFI